MLANENQHAFQDIDWGVFGFPGKNGEHSTIWIGSDGASTPLHMDTYGCNLIAQLSGKKSWTMFHPNDTDKLYPSRIPYEESSIFSEVYIENPDYSRHPKFKETTKYEVNH